MSDFSHEENVFIAKKVFELMKEQGVSRKMLAEITFVSDKTMQRLLRGESNFDMERLRRISEYFEVKMEYFLPEELSEGISLKHFPEYSSYLQGKMEIVSYLDGLDAKERECEMLHILTELFSYAVKTTHEREI